MTPERSRCLDPLRFHPVASDAAAYLASGDSGEEIAELVRRWTEPERPALLVVLDWEPPFADMYPEVELQKEFPDAPLVHAGSNDEDGDPRLLVYVIDEQGETVYAIPDPRAWH
jgi:hypothetical protein